LVIGDEVFQNGDAMSRSLILTTILVSALLPGIGAQESLSMKQIARERGGTAINLLYVSPPALGMADLVKRSDLIVRGRITSQVSRLSDDESTVYTDYTITPGRILKKPVELGISAAPGAVPEIIMQQPGGKVVVDGLHLETQTDVSDSDNPILVNAEYVFFLMKPVPSGATTRRARSGVFELTCGQFALFPVRNGKLVSFTRLAAARRPPPTNDPDAFLSSVQQMIAATQKEGR
jgi:hypothetical protein